MFKAYKDGKLPTRGSKYSASVDLYAREDVTIGAGETKLIQLGVCIDLDSSNVYKNSTYRWAEKKEPTQDVIDAMKKQYINDFCREHYLQLMLRSSMSKELIIANGVGVVDLDYKDEIMIRVHNPIQEHQLYADASGAICGFTYQPSIKIKKGDRVAQITLLEHKSYLFGIESKEERKGGFGSTGA